MNKPTNQLNREEEQPQIKLSTFKKFLYCCENENYHMVMHMLELIPLLGCSEREYYFMMEHKDDLMNFFNIERHCNERNVKPPTFQQYSDKMKGTF